MLGKSKLVLVCVFAVRLIAHRLWRKRSPRDCRRRRRETRPLHAKSLAGEQFTNESTKGKVVLFQFWTTWCRTARGRGW